MIIMMVNIAEAKAKLSELVDAAARGERVIICNRNQPVAELRPVEAVSTKARDLTPMFPGEQFMTDAFFEPMSEEELEEWYGGPVFPSGRVAETHATYSGRAAKKKRKK